MKIGVARFLNAISAINVWGVGMSKLIFVVGGARSGKSAYAASLCRGKVAFVATAEPGDGEMRTRIARHKRARPKSWRTYEAPTALAASIRKIPAGVDFILVDCLTLLISNLLCAGKGESSIVKDVRSACGALRSKRGMSVVVSNEVGLGIVPDNALGREFRDVAGRINQLVAKDADEVYFLISGIPWRIK